MGSYFISAVCEVLDEEAVHKVLDEESVCKVLDKEATSSEDLLSMLTEAVRRVATEKPQVPEPATLKIIHIRCPSSAVC